jgi:hypothetical protein
MRFVIAAEPGRSSSSLRYWDGTNWRPDRRKALLYADPELAERDPLRLRAKM